MNNTLTVNELKQFFGNGKFATVVFVKKGNGQLRVLNGKTSVKRAINGQGASYDAESRGQLRVFDVNVKDENGVRVGGYRTVTASNVVEVRANGKVYKVGPEIVENWIQVKESANPEDLTLMLTGVNYTYIGAGHLKAQIEASENKGKFFNENIRGKFDWKR